MKVDVSEEEKIFSASIDNEKPQQFVNRAIPTILSFFPQRFIAHVAYRQLIRLEGET